jgi:polar amino acid transport system substrate-binding protein
MLLISWTDSPKPRAYRSSAPHGRTLPRRHSVIALVLITLGLLTGCRQDEGAWPRIEREGVLRVGLDPTFPPFEVTDETGISGFDVDLATSLAEEMGLQAEFVYFGYDGLYDALSTEQVDVLISALVIAPERMRDFAYSEPYFNAGEILVRPSALGGSLDAMADLAGRRLAVELGAQGHVQAMEWAKRLPDMEILPLGSATEALDAVADGDADAALVDGVSGRLFLGQRGDKVLARAPEPVTVEPYAMVVRIGDETLLEHLNDALAALQADGRLENLAARWLGG